MCGGGGGGGGLMLSPSHGEWGALTGRHRNGNAGERGFWTPASYKSEGWTTPSSLVYTSLVLLELRAELVSLLLRRHFCMVPACNSSNRSSSTSKSSNRIGA